MRMQFWLVTTDHLTDRLWFRDDDDFKMGMNIVAILAATLNVRILAFILMSNHVHFVLEGDYEQVHTFITKFKKRYSQYFNAKYASKALLRRNGIDVCEIVPTDEALERAIAYVQMNSVAANICLYSNDYPWGSGGLFFSEMPRKGLSIKEFSGRASERLLHCRTKLPDNYLVTDEGYIDPASYVMVKSVESIFRTPKRMKYFLNNSSKVKRLHEGPSFPDQIVLAAINSLSVSLFRKSNLSELNEKELAEILKQLQYRLSCDPGQMARATGLAYEKVTELLDSV